MARLMAYASLAEQKQSILRISLEIDVGLRRGGFRDTDLFIAALEKIASSPWLQLSGLMGYEAHIEKSPAFVRNRVSASACKRYQYFAKLSSGICNQPLILNIGGSLTFARYQRDEPANEVSVGSAFLMPSDFDCSQNKTLGCAAFIGTRILKVLPDNPQPVLGFLRRNQIAIHGGYWQADPVYPEGFTYTRIFGRSSNQEIWETKSNFMPEVNDIAFLRPHQSEAVLSYVGQIIAIRGERIENMWNSYPAC